MSTIKANTYLDAAGGNTATINGAVPASLASPALTGTPTAPTASVGTNTTQIATTAFVNAEIANDAPTKTGTGASGTWGISITGTAGSTTVLNQVAGFPTANGQDFNSLTTGGYYNIVWGNYTGILNAPSGSANSYGTLLVQNGTNFTSQLYMPHATSSSPATRVLYSGSWTAWAYTLSSANYTSYSPSLTGSGATGTWGISVTGSAATAVNLSTTRTNWSTNGVISAVVGQLAWKNYGNSHTIIDASAGTAPDGSAINATNSQNIWISSYPTLMGWNGANTYGVRVDRARFADNGFASATWTDKTGSRANGTTYQNTTSGWLAVGVRDSNNGQTFSTGPSSASLVIATTNQNNGAVMGLVPPSYYYSVSGSSLQSWYEGQA